MCCLSSKLTFYKFLIQERFSIECCKTKVSTPTNRKKRNNTKDQSELEVNICNQCQARENACKRGMIGFGFASHWLRKWREFC